MSNMFKTCAFSFHLQSFFVSLQAHPVTVLSNSYTCNLHILDLKKQGEKKKSVAFSLVNLASALLPHLTQGFMLLSSHLKLYSHSLSNQQILVIMNDATEKHYWLIYYFGRAETFLSSMSENVFLVLWRVWCLKGDFAQEVCVFSLVVVVYLDVDYG